MTCNDEYDSRNGIWTAAGSRRWASRIVSCIGLGLIGLLVIPTGMLIGMMFVVWSVTDRIVRILGRKDSARLSGTSLGDDQEIQTRAAFSQTGKTAL